MVLIGSMAGSANLAACFLAVTLSSVRLMPMVASIMPDLRREKTLIWLLLFLSHFIAITAWVFSVQNLGQVPREARAAWFAGFGITLTLATALIVAVFYDMATAFRRSSPAGWRLICGADSAFWPASC